MQQICSLGWIVSQSIGGLHYCPLVKVESPVHYFSPVLLLTLVVSIADAATSAPATYAGVSGAAVLDSGAFVVVGGGPFDREENFEMIQRADGGHTVVNTVTAKSGSYRVQGRFDWDADWNAQSADGIGIHNGKAVSITMRRAGKQVKISVAPLDGSGKPKSAVTACDPSCFIDMSPSIMPMFVMTRHYDFAKGGEQDYLWAAQDLDNDRSLSTSVRMLFDANKEAKRSNNEPVRLRHFTFVESIPLPGGKVFKMSFDLWTDLEHRPMAFRAKSPGGAAAGIVGVRKGYEDLRGVL